MKTSTFSIGKVSVLITSSFPIFASARNAAALSGYFTSARKSHGPIRAKVSSRTPPLLLDQLLEPLEVLRRLVESLVALGRQGDQTGIREHGVTSVKKRR